MRGDCILPGNPSEKKASAAQALSRWRINHQVWRQTLQGSVLEEKTARLSIVSNTIFVAAKLAVGIISRAIHSIIGFIAAIIAGLSVRRSARPTSAAPPGTEKYESTSGFSEAVLILAAAVLIISEAAKNLLDREETPNVDGAGFGTIAMLPLAGVNYYISSRLMTAAKKTGPNTPKGDARHLHRGRPDSSDRFTGA